MRNRFLLIPFLVLLLIPSMLYANEPLVPLIMLFISPTTLGGAVYASFIGFLLVLIIKSCIFLWKSDFRSVTAIFCVIVANIISTFVGIIVVAMFTSSTILPIGLCFLYVVCLLPARRLRQFTRFSKNSIWFVAFFMTLMIGVTVFLYGLMIGFYHDPFLYWPVKMFMSIIAIVLSLVISIAYEEAVISGMYRYFYKKSKSFVQPVIWCNVVSIGILVLIGAIATFPDRLSSPDFRIGSNSLLYRTVVCFLHCYR